MNKLIEYTMSGVMIGFTILAFCGAVGACLWGAVVCFSALGANAYVPEPAVYVLAAVTTSGIMVVVLSAIAAGMLYATQELLTAFKRWNRARKN